jgi:hypothetical protein
MLKDVVRLISVMFYKLTLLLLEDDILILWLSLLDTLNISLSRYAKFVNAVAKSVF